MKVKLPIIGQVKTGNDAEEKSVEVASVKQAKKKALDILGGLLDFGGNKLSSEKTISSKLLASNKQWVYVNNDRIAAEVSKVEFCLYQMGMKDGEIVYNEIHENPLLDLLDQFNTTTTKSDALYVTQSDKKITGDAFWLLNKSNGIPQSIFILPPDKVELDLGNPTDASDDIVKSYTYKDVIDGKKVTKTYAKDQILHFKKPNPSNPFRGYGVVEAVANIIDLDNLTTAVQRQFFENGAISNFVLSTESKVTDEQLKRIKAEMRAAYTGAKNAFSTMILGGGLKPVDISYSNKDMQMLDQLEWYRDYIMIAFGNTKPAIGIIDDVNRSSGESSMIEWKRNTVEPEVQSIINTLNEFLVPMFGDKLVLGYKEFIPEDRTDDIAEATQLKAAGIISLNEARELLDYDPINGGDEMMTVQDMKDNLAAANQNNNDANKRIYRMAKKNLPRPLMNINLEKVLRKNKMYTQLGIHKEIQRTSYEIAKAYIQGKRKAKNTPEPPQLHAQFTNDVVMEYYEKTIHTVEAMEDLFEKKVTQFIAKIEKQVLANLDSEIDSIDKGVKKALFDEEDLIVEAQLDLTPVLMQEVVMAGQEAYRLIGKKDVYIPFKVEDKVRENVTKFTQSMLDTDRDSLVKLISDGIKEGKSVPEIRDAITNKFDAIKKNQASVVTRTEVLRAANMASEDAWEQSGVVEGKQWLTAGATDECAQYEGQIVTLGGNFFDSDNEFQDGDPPLHPNCRCVILPVVVGAKGVSFNRDPALLKKIEDLESQIDKRTKAFKDLQKETDKKSLDDAAYIKSLEALL